MMARFKSLTREIVCSSIVSLSKNPIWEYSHMGLYDEREDLSITKEIQTFGIFVTEALANQKSTRLI